MPQTRGAAAARRRRSAGPGSGQTTLAFKSKVTKPGASQTSLAKDSAAKAGKQQLAPAPPTTAEVRAANDEEGAEDEAGGSPAPGATPPPAQREPTEDELRAAKVPERQVRRYWKLKEDDRIFPRVHQKGLSVHDKVLREFDLSSQFGPCIGIGRHRRWERAQRLGLEPPIEVLAVLLMEEESQKGGVQMAYVDELLGSKQLPDEEAR